MSEVLDPNDRLHRIVVSCLIDWAKELTVVTVPCGQRVECGSTCWLQRGHDGPCCCISDDDGPGTCPA